MPAVVGDWAIGVLSDDLRPSSLHLILHLHIKILGVREKQVHYWRYLALLKEMMAWQGGAGSISERAGSNIMDWGMDGDFWLVRDLYPGMKGVQWLLIFSASCVCVLENLLSSLPSA
jgi:hypothetical protein